MWSLASCTGTACSWQSFWCGEVRKYCNDLSSWSTPYSLSTFTLPGKNRKCVTRRPWGWSILLHPLQCTVWLMNVGMYCNALLVGVPHQLGDADAVYIISCVPHECRIYTVDCSGRQVKVQQQQVVQAKLHAKRTGCTRKSRWLVTLMNQPPDCLYHFAHFWRFLKPVTS